MSSADARIEKMRIEQESLRPLYWPFFFFPLSDSNSYPKSEEIIMRLKTTRVLITQAHLSYTFSHLKATGNIQIDRVQSLEITTTVNCWGCNIAYKHVLILLQLPKSFLKVFFKYQTRLGTAQFKSSSNETLGAGFGMSSLAGYAEGTHFHVGSHHKRCLRRVTDSKFVMHEAASYYGVIFENNLIAVTAL